MNLVQKVVLCVAIGTVLVLAVIILYSLFRTGPTQGPSVQNVVEVLKASACSHGMQVSQPASMYLCNAEGKQIAILSTEMTGKRLLEIPVLELSMLIDSANHVHQFLWRHTPVYPDPSWEDPRPVLELFRKSLA